MDETAEPKKAKAFRPKNDSQSIAWRLMEANDITVLIGSPGTGKSFLAAAYAVSGLQSGEYDSIIILRSTTQSIRFEIGHLPGTTEDKTRPFMRPVKDAITKLGFEPDDKQTIECIPVGFIQGLTFDNAVVICDESQTLTEDEIKLVVGRWQAIEADIDWRPTAGRRERYGRFAASCRDIRRVEGFGDPSIRGLRHCTAWDHRESV